MNTILSIALICRLVLALQVISTMPEGQSRLKPDLPVTATTRR